MPSLASQSQGLATEFNKEAAEDAWDRLEDLGGHGVWEREMVILSLEGTGINDNDLEILKDLRFIQILNLSNTQIGDAGLAHVRYVDALESLIVVNTQMTGSALNAFSRDRPSVKIVTDPPPKGTINPFTGKPF